VCGQCGFSLTEAAQKIARSTGANPVAPPRPPLQSQPQHHGTMMGVAVPPIPPQGGPVGAPMSQGAPFQAPPQQRMGTMMGVAVPPVPPQAQAPSQHPPANQRMGTMMGVAVPPTALGNSAPPPAFAPVAPQGPPAAYPPSGFPQPPAQQGPPAGFAPPPSQGASASQRPPASTGRVGTMMGFAVPPEAVNQPAPPAFPGAEASLERLLAQASQRALRRPVEALSDALARHGLAVLGEPLRCEQELWGDYARDVRLLTAALEEGVPQQLMARAAGGLQAAHITTLARGFAETRGIAEEAAEYAVAAWALALRPFLGRG
jgi:hypothetical protein